MVTHKGLVADKGKDSMREGDWHLGIAEKVKWEKGMLCFCRVGVTGASAMVFLLNR